MQKQHLHWYQGCPVSCLQAISMSCPCQNTSYTEQPAATKSGLQCSTSRKPSSLLEKLLPGTHRERKKWYKWLNSWNRELWDCFSKSSISMYPMCFQHIAGPGRAGMKAGSVNLAQLPGWDWWKNMPALSIGSAFIHIPEVFTNWLVRKSDSSVILMLVCMQMNLPNRQTPNSDMLFRWSK